MKQFISLSVLMVLIASAAVMRTSAVPQTDQHRAMLDTYCVTCHNTRAKIGGLALDGLNLQAAADDAQVWEKALRKLRGNQMPPPGSPQPPQRDVESFVAWMENTLDSNARGPQAGYVPIQRFNRTEYAASVNALVGVDVNPKDVLPQDIQVEGFDNIADALSVSPAFLDQYVNAARQIAQVAVGNPNPRVSSVKYPIDANQNPDDPPPLGTWGGMKFKHSFPADGEYQITLTNLAVGPDSYPLRLEFFRTVGPNEQFFLDGAGAVLDGQIEFGEALVVVIPEPSAGALIAIALGLGGLNWAAARGRSGWRRRRFATSGARCARQGAPGAGRTR